MGRTADPQLLPRTWSAFDDLHARGADDLLTVGQPVVVGVRFPGIEPVAVVGLVHGHALVHLTDVRQPRIRPRLAVERGEDD